MPVKNTNPLYNKSIKEQFLKDSKRYGELSISAIRNIFKRCSEIEHKKNKDLFEFSDAEIRELLFYLGYSSVKSLHAAISILAQYIDWIISNSYTDDVINRFKNTIYTDRNSLRNFLDSQIRTKYISYDDYKRYIEILGHDYQKSVILTLLYNGILFSKNQNELCTIKKSQFFNNSIVLPHKVIYLSNEDSDIVKGAIEQGISFTTNKVYIEDVYILKKQRSDEGPIKEGIIFKTINLIGKIVDNPNMTAMSIYYSGLFHKLELMTIKNDHNIYEIINERQKNKNLLKNYVLKLMENLVVPFNYQTVVYNMIEIADSFTV